VEDLLDNPVYNALLSGDAAFANGSGNVRYFDEAVSPFAGFPIGDEYGFEELATQLPAGRRILFASITPIAIPQHWQLKAYIQGSQFVFDITHAIPPPALSPVALGPQHIDEMVALAALTKPGPFNKRTIEFGSYYGFLENNRVVAMTGQRLHVQEYAEISAVCTHPDALGKGYATALLLHQLAIILNTGKIPFLHVRSDNDRAIAIYERVGFRYRGPMHFYFLQRL